MSDHAADPTAAVGGDRSASTSPPAGAPAKARWFVVPGIDLTGAVITPDIARGERVPGVDRPLPDSRVIRRGKSGGSPEQSRY